MTLTHEIHESLASAWTGDRDAMARAILEDSAVEVCRQGRLSAFQIRKLPGYASRRDTEDFLSTHGARPGTTEEEARRDSRRLNNADG